MILGMKTPGAYNNCKITPTAKLNMHEKEQS